LPLFLLQSSAAQSGEEIMLSGKSIDDEENSQGQIPRLLGTCQANCYLVPLCVSVHGHARDSELCCS
jgi:hypothetical protein